MKILTLTDYKPVRPKPYQPIDAYTNLIDEMRKLGLQYDVGINRNSERFILNYYAETRITFKSEGVLTEAIKDSEAKL